MGADRWHPCPKCVQGQRDELAEAETDYAESYGVVSLTEYRAKEALVNALRELEVEDTMREDWELGIWDGKFSVRYSAYCTQCKFTFEFKEERSLT